MILLISLICILDVIFISLGLAKALALPKIRELAEEAGFSVAAYRRIGVLELAGAVGLALGPAVPLIGGLAGAGLVLLLAGAAIVHLRRGDGVAKLAPAAVCTGLVAAYLAVLFA